jgi:hypothetical protein
MTEALNVVPTFCFGSLCAKPVACPGHVKAAPQPSPEDWIVGSSPTLGSPATVGVKRVCLNVLQRLWGWQCENKKGVYPRMWNLEWLQQLHRGKSSLLRIRAKRSGELMKLKWGNVVADICGGRAVSCDHWMHEYKNTGLRVPPAPVPLELSQPADQQCFGDLLAWAKCVCRDRRQHGMSMAHAYFPDVALENIACENEVIRGMWNREVRRRTVRTACWRSYPMQILAGTTSPDRKIAELLYIQLCLKKLLPNIGFPWCPPLHECIECIIRKKDWMTRLARWTFVSWSI